MTTSEAFWNRFSWLLTLKIILHSFYFSWFLLHYLAGGRQWAWVKGGYLCGSHVSHTMYTPDSCQLSGEHAPLPTTDNPGLLGKYLVPGKGPRHLLSFGPINDTRTDMSSFALRNEGTETQREASTLRLQASKLVSEPTASIPNHLYYLAGASHLATELGCRSRNAYTPNIKSWLVSEGIHSRQVTQV